jgi:hypothetical protein
MGCPGCLLSEREQQEQINRITSEAKQYAIDNKKLVVIFFEDDRNVGYMDAEVARQIGIQPVKYLSWMS